MVNKIFINIYLVKKKVMIFMNDITKSSQLMHLVKKKVMIFMELNDIS